MILCCIVLFCVFDSQTMSWPTNSGRWWRIWSKAKTDIEYQTRFVGATKKHYNSLCVELHIVGGISFAAVCSRPQPAIEINKLGDLYSPNRDPRLRHIFSIQTQPCTDVGECTFRPWYESSFSSLGRWHSAFANDVILRSQNQRRMFQSKRWRKIQKNDQIRISLATAKKVFQSFVRCSIILCSS